MAIEGQGTAADPWIVHDWNDLLETISSATPTGGKYIKLANDIQAPSTGTSLTFASFAEIDGNSYTIKDLLGNITLGPTYGSSVSFKLKNISFTNIYCNGADLFDYIGSNSHSSYLIFDNVRISGIFNSGNIFKTHDYSYMCRLNVQSMAINAETQNGAFQLESGGYNCMLNNVNAKITYTNCTPQNALLKGSWQVAENCLFDIEAENASSNLAFGGKVKNCCFIGKGHGITIDSAEGVNVIEDTLPLNTTLSNVYSVTTTQMKNAQYLHNLGFPIGVN